MSTAIRSQDVPEVEPATTSTTTSPGMMRATSTRRISTASTQSRRNAATRPIVAPIEVPMAAATPPTSSDWRVPRMTWPSRS